MKQESVHQCPTFLCAAEQTKSCCWSHFRKNRNHHIQSPSEQEAAELLSSEVDFFLQSGDGSGRCTCMRGEQGLWWVKLRVTNYSLGEVFPLCSSSAGSSREREGAVNGLEVGGSSFHRTSGLSSSSAVHAHRERSLHLDFYRKAPSTALERRSFSESAVFWFPSAGSWDTTLRSCCHCLQFHVNEWSRKPKTRLSKAAAESFCTAEPNSIHIHGVVLFSPSELHNVRN